MLVLHDPVAVRLVYPLHAVSLWHETRSPHPVDRLNVILQPMGALLLPHRLHAPLRSPPQVLGLRLRLRQGWKSLYGRRWHPCVNNLQLPRKPCVIMICIEMLWRRRLDGCKGMF